MRATRPIRPTSAASTRCAGSSSTSCPEIGGFYTNFELRFPLIDFFITPVLSFQGIQGRFFLDIAGAWYSDFQDFDFYDEDTNTLVDGLSTYGFGITVRFFGVDLHWDFSKKWDFKESEDFTTSFWIGQRF